MAAPALAASIADCAICAGVTGTAGLRPGVSAEPVTAHETMTLRCMPLSQDTDRALQRSLARGRCRAQSFAWAEWIKANGCGSCPQSVVQRVNPNRSHSDCRESHLWAAGCLPRIVHCAKPPRARPWNGSDLKAISRTLAAGRGGAFRTGPEHRR